MGVPTATVGLVWGGCLTILESWDNFISLLTFKFASDLNFIGATSAAIALASHTAHSDSGIPFFSRSARRLFFGVCTSTVFASCACACACDMRWSRGRQVGGAKTPVFVSCRRRKKFSNHNCARLTDRDDIIPHRPTRLGRRFVFKFKFKPQMPKQTTPTIVKVYKHPHCDRRERYKCEVLTKAPNPRAYPCTNRHNRQL